MFNYKLYLTFVLRIFAIIMFLSCIKLHGDYIFRYACSFLPCNDIAYTVMFFAGYYIHKKYGKVTLLQLLSCGICCFVLVVILISLLPIF